MPPSILTPIIESFVFFVKYITVRLSAQPHRLYAIVIGLPNSNPERNTLIIAIITASLNFRVYNANRTTMFANPSFTPGIGIIAFIGIKLSR